LNHKLLVLFDYLSFSDIFNLEPIHFIEKYMDKKEIKRKILAMTPEGARERGVKHRSTLKRIKDKIRQGKKINLKGKEISKLFYI